MKNYKQFYTNQIKILKDLIGASKDYKVIINTILNRQPNEGYVTFQMQKLKPCLKKIQHKVVAQDYMKEYHDEEILDTASVLLTGSYGSNRYANHGFESNEEMGEWCTAELIESMMPETHDL